jgi:hypothetical protein
VFAKYKHPNFRPADNDRLSGWSQIRQRLVAKPALLYITTQCPALLESLPSLAIDKRRPEDVDTEGNDHLADATRYMLKERLIDSKWEQPAEVFNKGVIKLQAYIAQMRSQRGRATI